jgi:hypothetical protein
MTTKEPKERIFDALKAACPCLSDIELVRLSGIAATAVLEAPPAPQHSPLPWRRDRGDVLDARGHLVNLFAPEELDLVIPACNGHGKAVELATMARDVSYKGSVYPADLAPLFKLSGEFLRLTGEQP